MTRTLSSGCFRSAWTSSLFIWTSAIFVPEPLKGAGAQSGVYTPRRKAALANMHFLVFVCLRAHVVLDATMLRSDADPRALAVRSSTQHTAPKFLSGIVESAGRCVPRQQRRHGRGAWCAGAARVDVRLASKNL
ncbi:hypothetical protein DFH11DRAFT_1733707 [Phellopilus nigrolimitatus]|nr:hypothetical protein DFH11DRAFT_1733707 [Phellopilus nigrolimitatus]